MYFPRVDGGGWVEFKLKLTQSRWTVTDLGKSWGLSSEVQTKMLVKTNVGPIYFVPKHFVSRILGKQWIWFKKFVSKRMLCQKQLGQNTCWSKVNFGSRKLRVQGFESEKNLVQKNVGKKKSR